MAARISLFVQKNVVPRSIRHGWPLKPTFADKHGGNQAAEHIPKKTIKQPAV
jgi:hypothetical protein